MRIFIFTVLLCCTLTAVSSFAQSSQNSLQGTYILIRGNNQGFIFDYTDTAATLKSSYKQQLENRKGMPVSTSDSIRMVGTLRENIKRVYQLTRFKITFNPDKTFTWKMAVSDQKFLNGTYSINAEGTIITLTHHDTGSGKANKMYLKLLTEIVNTIVVQSGDDKDHYKEGKLTLKKL